MLLEYLENELHLIINENKRLEENVKTIHVRKNENDKFIDMLKSEGSVFFADFTPRDVHNKNIKKIREVENEQLEFDRQESVIKQRIFENNIMIENLDQCISEYKMLKNKEIQLEELKTYKQSKDHIDDIIEKVNNSIRYALDCLPGSPDKARELLMKLQNDIFNVL